MGKLAQGHANGTASGPPIDWQALRAAILANLDVAAEFAALGVEFTRPSARSNGIRECRAFGREDSNPSAFINVRTGVYHDSGGAGETLNLFDFALKYGDFGRWIDVLRRYAERAGVPFGRAHASAGGRVAEATYLYRDPAGAVAYRVVRWRLPNGKKQFSQNPPDGRGGWVTGSDCMAGVELFPYRLPELIAADPGETAWLVEGEKDAERAAAEGLVATCNPMGAGKWHDEYSRWFDGRACVIIPDHDDPGRAHAARVAAGLRGLARSVKVVNLPGVPPKGDLSDWLDQGGTVEELGRLAYAAPEWAPPAEGAAPGPFPVTAPDEDGLPPDEDVITVCLSDVVAVPVEWLWPGRVPIGKLTLLAGQAKQGKSFLTMDFAARISVGGLIPCGEGECMPLGSVVLLSAEDDLDDTVKPRLIAAGADTDKVHALTTVRLADGTLGPFDLSYISSLERAIVRRGDTKLVIIDPVTHYIGSRVDDHKVAQLRALLGPLKDLAARRKVAILVVSHFNKGGSSGGSNALHRVIGSSAYTALARANWFVLRDPKDPARRLMLDAGNNLAPDPPGLAFRIVDGRLQWEDSTVGMDAHEALRQEQEEQRAERRTESGAGKVAAASDWLANLLASGTEILSGEIMTQGRAKGFSRDTLFAAKKDLGIQARKRGNTWAWFREEVQVSGEKNAQDTSTVRHFDTSNGPNGHQEDADIPF